MTEFQCLVAAQRDINTKELVGSLPNEATEQDRIRLSLGAEGTYTSLECNVGACAVRATATTRVDGNALTYDFCTSNPRQCQRGEESLIPDAIQPPENGGYSIRFVF